MFKQLASEIGYDPLSDPGNQVVVAHRQDALYQEQEKQNQDVGRKCGQASRDENIVEGIAEYPQQSEVDDSGRREKRCGQD